MKRIIGTLIILLMAQLNASAHSWYTGMSNPITRDTCCGGKDCFPISIERVVEKSAVYVVDGKYAFPKDQALPSPDGNYHVCIYGGKVHCMFFPSNV